MQNKKTIGYDETKKMLNTLRRLNESKKFSAILKEEEEVSSEKESDITVINDVDVKIESPDEADMKLSDEHKKSISGIIDSFRQMVSNLAELEPGLFISKEQIRLDGELTDVDIKFTIVAGDESGVYITSQMTKLTKELIDIYQKLDKFYLTYVDAMNPIITDRKNN